jgi:hypothetical protein
MFYEQKLYSLWPPLETGVLLLMWNWVRSMNGKNPQLVTDERLEFDKNNRFSSKAFNWEIYPLILEEFAEYSSTGRCRHVMGVISES